jgi:hypothetical protein
VQAPSQYITSRSPGGISVHGLFFPAFPVTEAELVAAGVAETTAGRILSQLAYLGNTADLLVVEQRKGKGSRSPRPFGNSLGFAISWCRSGRRVVLRSF